MNLEKDKIDERTPNIYVLSVGINRYLSKNISNLRGCVDDVFRLKTTLQRLFNIPDSQYMTCINEEATRMGIIDAFRSHFSQLEEKDIALFHYSGHGSWEPTHQIFIDGGYEPKGGRNEVIVCSNSQVNETPNISDKELRCLVAKTQNHYNGQSKKIKFYGIFDCCFSGSILRNQEIRSRMIPSTMFERDLNTYFLEGFHFKSDKKDKIILPEINYISLTACSPYETAREDDEGGIFTNALIKVLEQKGKIGIIPSFAELHFLSRLLVQKKSNNLQNPYFEYYGIVDPNAPFLFGEKYEFSLHPSLIFDENQWIVNLGALHGIKYPTWKHIKIKVNKRGNRKEFLGIARISKVRLEHTIVSITWNQSVSEIDKNNLEIGLYPQALSFRLTITENGVKDWEHLQKKINQSQLANQIYWNSDANYELEIKENKYLLNRYSEDKKKLIIGIKNINKLSINTFLQHVQKVINWTIIKNIQSSKPLPIIYEKIDFVFIYWNQFGEKVTHLVGENQKDCGSVSTIQIPFRFGFGYIFYRIEVQNNFIDSKGLYFYIVHLGDKFGINQKNETYLKAQYYKERQVLYDSLRGGKALGINDSSIDEVIETYLLIATQEPLTSPYVFDQQGFGNFFGKVVSLQELNNRKKEISVKKNSITSWIVKQLVVKIVKNN